MVSLGIFLNSQDIKNNIFSIMDRLLQPIILLEDVYYINAILDIDS